MQEPSRWCRNCGKPLTNPMSVQLGMGPVCYPRRRTRHPRQKRAMSRDPSGIPRADYTWHLDGEVVVIVDLDRGRSVTNDADRVIEDLIAAGLRIDDYAVIYLDTMKRWDGLATHDGRFAGFIPLGKTDYAEARDLANSARARAWVLGTASRTASRSQ